MTDRDPHAESRAPELDARLAVPKDETRLLWWFTTILVLLATLVPYAGRARAANLQETAVTAAAHLSPGSARPTILLDAVVR